MFKIVFVCVDYNGYQYTKQLFASLEKQSGRNKDFLIHCVVVDNSTDKENSEKLRECVNELNWAVYLKPQKNTGYFGGLNIGIESLDIGEWDFLVICNNDLDFDADFCGKLISTCYPDNIFSICPDVITFDGLHQNPHLHHRIGALRRLQFDIYYFHYFFAFALISVLKVVRPVKFSPPQPNCAHEVHMGIGACYVLTRAFLGRFSKLIYPHFLYGEEAFFSDQIHSAGGILWYDPNLVVHHAESASTSKIPKRVAYEFARQGYSDYRKML